jgi:hypothetical protein
MHAVVPQLTSHLQELLQSTLPAQLFMPEQMTLHRPVPQVMGPAQDVPAVQSISQLDAAEQSTPAGHAPVNEQSTVHGIPAGHTTCEAHAPADAQWMRQVPFRHSSQAAGHTNMASGTDASGAFGLESMRPPSIAVPSTHQPPTQLRPLSQSAGPLQR